MLVLDHKFVFCGDTQVSPALPASLLAVVFLPSSQGSFGMVHYAAMSKSVTHMGRRCPACGKDSWPEEADANRAIGRTRHGENRDRRHGLILPGEQGWRRPRQAYQCADTGLWHVTSASTEWRDPGDLWIEKMKNLSELQLPDVDRAGLDWQEYRLAVAEAILREIRRRRDFFRFPSSRDISLRYTLNQAWVVRMRDTIAELGWLRYDEYANLWITRRNRWKNRD